MKIWDHEITTAGKCRGEKKVVSKICDMAIADMEPGSEYQIEYGNDEKIKEEMAAKDDREAWIWPDRLFPDWCRSCSECRSKNCRCCI